MVNVNKFDDMNNNKETGCLLPLFGLICGIGLLYGAYRNTDQLYVYNHGYNIGVTITNIDVHKRPLIEFDYKGEKCKVYDFITPWKYKIGEKVTVRTCDRKPGVFVDPSRSIFSIFITEMLVPFVIGIFLLIGSIFCAAEV